MELSAAEESFKKPKSRVNWLALGDNHTKFFHHKVSSHRVRNKILSLVNADGIRLEILRMFNRKLSNAIKGFLVLSSYTGRMLELPYSRLLDAKFLLTCKWT